jgi:hypothetical protein
MQDVPGAAYFNYDYSVKYYRGGNGEYEAVRTLLENPKLRGRKFYWHRKSALLDSTSAFPEQRAQIRPVKSGKTFRFEIAFDRLTQKELETILWVLTFGAQNQTHAHKLGHAKPYGYGSVRVTKAEVKTVVLGDDLTLTETCGKFTPGKPRDSEYLSEYLAMTDFSKATDTVKYPIGDKGAKNSPSVYEWFGINKEIQLGGFNPSFNYVLPKPTDDSVGLPKYERGQGEKGGARKQVFADKPEAGYEEASAQSSEKGAGGAKISDILAANKGEQASKVAKKTVYDRRKLKLALESYTLNPQSKKLLESFMRDYETDPAYYKDFKQNYENIARKLGK